LAQKGGDWQRGVLVGMGGALAQRLLTQSSAAWHKGLLAGTEGAGWHREC